MIRVTSSGQAAQGPALSAAGVYVDGHGSPLVAGIVGRRTMASNGVITGWSLLADVAGSVAFEIRKSTYAGYPAKTVISGATPPALAGQIKASGDVAGWSDITFTRGDVLEFAITGVPATLTQATLSLSLTETP